MPKCALCQQEKELQISHIVPKFVGKYLKKTSIGDIRNQESPNQVIQDIEKHAMLCHDCEELFSASERYFANTIFYPYLRDKKDIFNYDKRLFFFLTSLAWRSLYLDICDFAQKGGIQIEVFEKMITSEKIMRDYLLGKRHDIGYVEHHIFFFDRVESTSRSDIDSPNVTVHRAICSYSGNSDNTIYTISNMMGIIAITLYSIGSDERWERTKIINGEGCIEAKSQIMESRVGGEIQYWIERASEASSQLNESQKQKILQRIREVGEDIKAYPMYQDFIDDRNLTIDSTEN